MEERQVRPTKLMVHTQAIKHNILEIQKIVKKETKIMPVLKANAYGIGIEKMIEMMQELNIQIVAVAIVDEGVYLRKLGYTGEIFVLNQPYLEEIQAITQYHLTVGVSSLEFIRALGEKEKPVTIHLEIGTGMGRTGIRPSRTGEVIDNILKYKNIALEGIYTHFSSSDTDREYTKHQIFSFEKAVATAKEKVNNLKYVHACNSAGILNFPEAHYDLVRPGIMLYGYVPDESLAGKLDLEPCCVLKSKVSFIKQIEEGFHIGYEKSFTTTRKTTVLTVPIGYADGVRRILSNKGQVVIKNQLAPIIGSVCMDSIMVDGTEIEAVDVGTDVYLWDNNIRKIEEVAKECDTIHYEILSSITNRVKREYS